MGFFHNLPQLRRPEGGPGQQGHQVGDLPNGAGHIGKAARTGMGLFWLRSGCATNQSPEESLV